MIYHYVTVLWINLFVIVPVWFLLGLTLVQCSGWGQVWGSVSLLWFVSVETIEMVLNTPSKSLLNGRLNNKKCLSCMLVSHQISADSHWTQIQLTSFSNCLKTTGRWQIYVKSTHILNIQRDLITGLRSCVKMIWLVVVTGRWSGSGRFMLQWVTEESGGMETAMGPSLEGMTSPGVWPALMGDITPGTTTAGHSFPPPPSLIE